MNWFKEKLQNARELVAKPVEWAQENKYKPVVYAVKTKDYLKLHCFKARNQINNKIQEAIKKEEERNFNEKL